MGQKTAFLVHLPYPLNRLELSAHILTQGRSWDELVPFGHPVDFRLGGSIFGAKTVFLVHLPYPLNHLEFIAHILTQGKSWAEMVPLGCHVKFGLEGSIFGAKNYVFATFAIPLNVAISRLPWGVAANVFGTKTSYELF